MKYLFLSLSILLVGCNPYKDVARLAQEIEYNHRHSEFKHHFRAFYELQMIGCLLESNDIDSCNEQSISNLVRFELEIAKDYVWFQHSNPRGTVYVPSRSTNERLWRCLEDEDFMEKSRYIYANKRNK